MIQQQTAVSPVRTETELAQVRLLFQEYAAELKVDLCFQRFAEELAALPGSYAPPSGELLLARAANQPAGCVALRRYSDDAAELKRLYVRPAYRGLGLGRELTREILERARRAGYRRVVLDTLASLKPAIRLYQREGFRQTKAYYANPLPDVLYFELELR